MPWYNPLSWNDGYRSKLDDEIKQLGDAAAAYFEDTSSRFDDLPERAQAALWEVINGKQEPEYFYEALREARVDKTIERKYMALMKDK